MQFLLLRKKYMDFIVGMFLLIEGIQDFRAKRISLWRGLCFGMLGLGISIISDRPWSNVIWAEVPGLICIIISYCSRQAIGYGDGFLLCMLGTFYEIGEVLFILFVAMGFAGILGLVLLVLFQKNGKQEIPFVPFLFVGWFIFHGITWINGGIL